MAQGKSNKNKLANAGKPAKAPRVVVDRRPQPPPGTRQSVAAARQTSASSNRTQMIIGIVAVSLIAIVVIVGLVLNKKQNASPVTDYPTSNNSVASVAGGVITVAPASGTPKATIDVFEDGICPACQAFEAQYGQQLMQAVDQGKLSIRYHFLNFLNPNSASKDYSTRAAAAFECVAATPAASAPKGLFMNFHTTMFKSGTQPAESGTADLSNAQIAEIATKAGVPAATATCISAGTNVEAAKTAAAASQAVLEKAAGTTQWGTPSVMKDGSLISINSTDWLANLIA